MPSPTKRETTIWPGLLGAWAREGWNKVDVRFSEQLLGFTLVLFYYVVKGHGSKGGRYCGTLGSLGEHIPGKMGEYWGLLGYLPPCTSPLNNTLRSGTLRVQLKWQYGIRVQQTMSGMPAVT